MAAQGSAVGARLAREHGAMDIPVQVGLLPLRSRELPFVVVPVCWASAARKLDYYRAVAQAAGLTTAARTESGLESRCFEGLTRLAREEARQLHDAGQIEKAQRWIKAIGRVAAARKNLSHFGRVWSRHPAQRDTFRQTTLHETPNPDQLLAASFQVLQGRAPPHGPLSHAFNFPEDPIAELMDALFFLSRGHTPWLPRDQVCQQCTPDVLDDFEALLGALQSMNAVHVAVDGQIRLDSSMYDTDRT